MAGAPQLTPQEVELIVQALEDAMFFRDARSRIPKMSAESKQRDKTRVVEYEGLTARLKKPAR